MYKRNKANSRPSGLLFGEFLPAGNSGRSVHRDDARMHDPTCAGTKTKDKELLLLSKALSRQQQRRAGHFWNVEDFADGQSGNNRTCTWKSRPDSFWKASARNLTLLKLFCCDTRSRLTSPAFKINDGDALKASSNLSKVVNVWNKALPAVSPFFYGLDAAG